MRWLVLILTGMLCGTTHAQEMVGPREVAVGRSVWLDLEGISVDELRSGEVNIFPRGRDVQIRPFQDLAGNPVLWFESNERGQFDIYIVAAHLVDGAARIKSASWTIQVGPPTPPPPDPEDPTSPEDPTENPYPRPAADLQAVVEPIRAVTIDRQQAQWWAAMFALAAERVPSQLQRTDQLRQYFFDSLRKLNIAPSATSVAEPILRQRMGLDYRTLTQQDVALLRAMAWAAWEAGEK
jgi:hypothetical protein